MCDGVQFFKTFRNLLWFSNTFFWRERVGGGGGGGGSSCPKGKFGLLPGIMYYAITETFAGKFYLCCRIRLRSQILKQTERKTSEYNVS